MKFNDFFKLRELTLNITNKCNLKCNYCFEHNKNGYQMSDDIAIKALDKCYNNYELHKDEMKAPFMVNFFGGEPFLNFSLMENLMKYARQKNYDIEFGVTTNLTILTDHMIDVIEEYELGMLISIDGIREIHNRNRCGSYDIVKRNIQKLLDKHLGYLLEARITVMPQDAYKLFESVKSIVDLGLVNIAPVPVTDVNWSESELNDLRNSLRKIWEWLFEIYNDDNNKKNISIKVIEDYLEKVLTFEAIPEQFSVCSAGCNSNCSIGTNGEIMPCHQRHTIADKHNELIFGNISSDDIKEINFNNFTRNSLLNCEKCIAKNVCRGGCPSENLTVNGNANLMNENQCKIFQVMVEIAIEYQDKLLKCSNIRSRRLNAISENLKLLEFFKHEVLSEKLGDKNCIKKVLKLYEMIMDKENVILPLFNQAIKLKIEQMVNNIRELMRKKNGNHNS